MEPTQINNLVFIGELVIAIIVVVCTAYLNEKGKNQATKEDIKEITEEVERVKNDFAQLLSVNSYRYKKEFDSLTTLMRDVVKFKRASADFSVFLSTNTTLNNSTAYNKIFMEWVELYETLMCNTEVNKPFFQQAIFSLVLEFEKVVSTSIYKARLAFRAQDENAIKYSNEVEILINKANDLYRTISDAVQQRVCEWESSNKSLNN